MSAPSRLRLRPLRAGDEGQALAAHAELATDDFQFLVFRAKGEDWSSYVRARARERFEPPASDRVRATFLLAVVGDELVGRVSIRFALTELLHHHGGHIGYAVRPGHRCRGYATEILGQALIVARAEGVERVLLTCYDDNRPSASVIEHHGGRLEDVRSDPEITRPWRRYWID